MLQPLVEFHSGILTPSILYFSDADVFWIVAMFGFYLVISHAYTVLAILRKMIMCPNRIVIATSNASRY